MPPQTTPEKFFVIASQLVGSLTFAYFVGNITQLVANIDATQSLYKEKLEQVEEYMRYQNLPIDLRYRIRSYYHHSYAKLNASAQSEDAIFHELSGSLRREIMMFLNDELVQHVPFFKGRDRAFISSLVVLLRLENAGPQDYVILAGEVGSSMYFIRRGELDVVSADRSTVYTTLRSGQYFGELALLDNSKRTASVRSVNHCELLTLSRDDFTTLLSDYPEVEAEIRTLAANAGYKFSNSKKDKEERIADEDMQAQLDQVIDELRKLQNPELNRELDHVTSLVDNYEDAGKKSLARDVLLKDLS